jgi:transmembrane sensor
MDNNNTYQPGKEDLALARLIGEIREKEENRLPVDDPIAPFLSKYKQSVNLKKSGETHDEIWKNIESNLDSDRRIAPVFKLTGTFLKFAAVVLVASLLTLFYFTFKPLEPVLLSESFSEKVVVELTDGSLITLRPFSKLYSIEETDEEWRYEIEGEALFEIVSRGNRNFAVISDGARVDVTGTRFMFSNWGGVVRVFLEEGGVTFSTLDFNESVNLMPGQFSEFNGDFLSEPELTEISKYNGWLSNKLVLDSRPMRNIIEEISHHFNVRLVVPDDLNNERLTGTLSLENLDLLISDLSLSLGGRFIEVEEDLYRFERTF